MVEENTFAPLVDPILAALEAIVATTRSSDSPPMREASQFLQWKVFATVLLGARIRNALEAGTSTLTVQEDRPWIEVNREAKFDLFLLVDIFLFECASIKDALVQFVNVLFELGIAADDTRIATKVGTRLGVTVTSKTGLEPWLEEACSPSWLTTLTALRKITTHRRPLRMPEAYHWTVGEGGTPTAWESEVAIEDGHGGIKALGRFVQEVGQEATDLLRQTLDDLRVFMTKSRAGPGSSPLP